MAGIGEGSVHNFTKHCFCAIKSLHDVFVRPLTEEEKEQEKRWMEKHMGFGGLWQEGYLMYDGTIVVLYAQPGLDGAAYYTYKANYGINVQIGNTPSNLQIVDYSTGHTGLAYDVSAFEYTTAYCFPELLFRGEEFAWADLAYRASPHLVPIHKQPTSSLDYNTYFDCNVSSFCV
uniref:DDE Tnp4 domain-containing protein n=1 Tax=Moniliophthora roreri TaxID=221103 RepID=A0A0W0GE27_MONRR